MVVYEAQIYDVIYDDFGSKITRKNMDVYLSPLNEDLKFLWEEGIDVDESYLGEILICVSCYFA